MTKMLTKQNLLDVLDVLDADEMERVALAANAIDQEGLASWKASLSEPVPAKVPKKRRADVSFLEAIGHLDVERMREAVADGALDLPSFDKKSLGPFLRWSAAAMATKASPARAAQTLLALDEMGLPVAPKPEDARGKTPVPRPANPSKASRVQYQKACLESLTRWVEFLSVGAARAPLESLASLVENWVQSGEGLSRFEACQALLVSARDDALFVSAAAAFCKKTGESLGAEGWEMLSTWFEKTEYDIEESPEELFEQSWVDLVNLTPAGEAAAAGGMLTQFALEMDSAKLLAAVAANGVLAKALVHTRVDELWDKGIGGLPTLLAAIKCNGHDKKKRRCFEALATSPQAVKEATERFDARGLGDCSVEEALELFERFPAFAGRGVDGVNVAGVWAQEFYSDPIKKLTKLMGAGFGHLITEPDDQGSTALSLLEESALVGRLHREEVDKFRKAFAGWEGKALKKELAKPASRAKKKAKVRL